MKKSVTLGVVTAMAAAAISLGAAAPASAVPDGSWTLTGRTPISTGYMYTYRNSAGAYYVTAQFQGNSFVVYNVR